MIAFTLGGTLVQVPLGRLSDRMDRRYVIAGISLLACLAGIALYLFGGRGTEWALVLVAVFGVVALPLYGLSVAHANDRLHRDMFVEASATLLMINAVASVIGPPIAAMVTARAGMSALFLYTAAVHFALLVFTLVRIQLMERPPEENREPYAPVPQNAESRRARTRSARAGERRAVRRRLGLFAVHFRLGDGGAEHRCRGGCGTLLGRGFGLGLGLRNFGLRAKAGGCLGDRLQHVAALGGALGGAFAANMRALDREVEFKLRAQAERDRIHRLDVLRVPVRALADLLDGGLGGADQLDDVGIGEFGVVAQDPIDRVGLVLALRHGRVARRLLLLDGGHLVLGRGHLEAELGVRLGRLDLLAGELAGGDGVQPLDALGHVLVGDALHLERMQAAEIGHLLEGERGVVDQPDGGRLGHQGSFVGHRSFLSRAGLSGPVPSLDRSRCRGRRVF